MGITIPRPPPMGGEVNIESDLYHYIIFMNLLLLLKEYLVLVKHFVLIAVAFYDFIEIRQIKYP